MISSLSRSFRLAVVSIALAGCASAPSAPQPVATPFVLTEHAGVWASHGYGWVIEIARERTRLFHAAGDVCVEDPAIEDSIVPLLDRGRVEDQGDALVLWSEIDSYPYRFSRRAALPAACAKPTADTPRGNFEAFAAFFAQHYAFFALYGVDWPARVAAARAQIDDGAGATALFELMRQAVLPLADGHLEIEAEIDGKTFEHEGNQGGTESRVVALGLQRGESADEAVHRFRRAYWLDGIRDDLLQGRGVITANGRIQFGMAGDVGYLAVVSMGGYVEGDDHEAAEELPALDAAMEQALQRFETGGAKAVIVDLSLNTGGYDFVGRAIAGRFAAERTVGYRKRAGDDPASHGVEMWIAPAQGRRFTGPVFVLTSDQTVSAAETTTLALRALPHVRHVGQPTRGSLSDILNKYLPNGWVLSLSNEVYTDHRGEKWEGHGIAPQMLLPVFGDQPPHGHVAAVRRVLEMIHSEVPVPR